jgi:zinc/manganese transport system permease protein
MLSQPFMQHALLAGTAVALAAGLVGYFLVLRAQVFTADALSHVAFTGALAALAAGLDVRVGLFAVTLVVALGMAGLGRRARPDDVVIGGVFAWILGLGVLFLTVYTRSRSGTGDGSASVAVLFGSILGLSGPRALLAAVIAAGICLLLLAIARPLLFASLDEAVAAAAGVPVRLLGFGFLALVAATTAEATQVVGALLILGLVAAPAGAAIQLTDRPWRALGLSAAIAVGSVWLGLALSYAAPVLPPSFAILAVAGLAFAAATATGRWRTARPDGRARRAMKTGGGRRLRWLAVGLAVLATGWVFASPAHRPPLYDGVGFPDEPYRYVNPPPDSRQTEPPTVAQDTRSTSTGRPDLVPASLENGPHAQAYIPGATLGLPAGATEVTARMQPLAPAAPLPTDGTVWGNVYRLTLSSPPGPVSLTPSNDNSTYVDLRAPSADQPPPVVEALVAGSWHRLDTNRDGNDVYGADIIGLGDYALVRLGPTSPGAQPAAIGPGRGTAGAARATAWPTIVILAGMLTVVVAGIVAVRFTRRPGDRGTGG